MAAFDAKAMTNEPVSQAGHLFDEVYDWAKEHPRTVEIAGAAVAGIALVASRGRIGEMLESSEAARLLKIGEINEVRSAFLNTKYLTEPYLVPEPLQRVLESATTTLAQKYPEITSLTAAGGKANGSFMLRSLFQNNPGSDFDFYLVGHDIKPDRLYGAAMESQKGLRAVRTTADPLLNGSSPDIYLNLDRLPAHINNADYNLLALPFQSSFGKTAESQAAVLRAVIAHPNKDEVWKNIVAAHAESLSMHHGTWSLDFNNEILHDYLPKKIARFGLPSEPETLLNRLAGRTSDAP